MLPILENKYTDDHTEDNNIKKKLTVVSATNNFLTCSLERLHDQKWDYNCKGFVVSGHIKSYLENCELPKEYWSQACAWINGRFEASELLLSVCLSSVSEEPVSMEEGEGTQEKCKFTCSTVFDWKSSGGDQTLWEFKIKASNHWLQISGLRSVVLLLWSSEKL